MSFLRRVLKPSTDPVAVVESVKDLDRFLAKDCPAAIWRREMPAPAQAWLDGLNPETLPRGRVTLRPDDVADAVAHLCDMAETPSGPERGWLVDDVADIAQAFARLMTARYLRMRLDVVTHNACRKFHVDAIRARLVCTYRGTGTQYGVSVQGADPAPIKTVSTGAPILLRGSQWPEIPASGLLHRSPPIEGTGETRLVLVLDPVFDPEDDLGSGFMN